MKRRQTILSLTAFMLFAPPILYGLKLIRDLNDEPNTTSTGSTTTAPTPAKGKTNAPVSGVDNAQEESTERWVTTPALAKSKLSAPVKKAQEETRRMITEAQARAEQGAAQLTPNQWRNVGERAAKLGMYDEAAQSFEEAAKISEENNSSSSGDGQEAKKIRTQSAQWKQNATLYVDTGTQGPENTELKNHEPQTQLLLGLHATAADLRMKGPAPELSPQAQGSATVAIPWTLAKAGTPRGGNRVFPNAFAEAAKKHKKALFLTLDLGKLEKVTDERMIEFAEEARAADIPIFISLGPEANSPSAPWKNNPALYQKTFRKLHAVLRAYAPNAATVWTVRPGDIFEIHRYYPGVEHTDWVGMKLQSSPFASRAGAAPQDLRASHPLDAVTDFYATYARYHPVMLSAYSAAHTTSVKPGQSFSAYAERQLRETYWSALLEYPRIKAIQYLPQQIKTGRGQEDHRLFTNAAKTNAYRSLSKNPHFSASVKNAEEERRRRPVKLSAVEGNVDGLPGYLALRTAEPIGGLSLSIGKKTVVIEQKFPHRFTFPKLTPGEQEIQITAWNTKGQIILERQDIRTVQTSKSE